MQARNIRPKNLHDCRRVMGFQRSSCVAIFLETSTYVIIETKISLENNDTGNAITALSSTKYCRLIFEWNFYNKPMKLVIPACNQQENGLLHFGQSCQYDQSPDSLGGRMNLSSLKSHIKQMKVQKWNNWTSNRCVIHDGIEINVPDQQQEMWLVLMNLINIIYIINSPYSSILESLFKRWTCCSRGIFYENHVGKSFYDLVKKKRGDRVFGLF